MLKHFLMATALPLPVSFAATTTPYAPLPSRLCVVLGMLVGGMGRGSIDRSTDRWMEGRRYDPNITCAAHTYTY